MQALLSKEFKGVGMNSRYSRAFGSSRICLNMLGWLSHGSQLWLLLRPTWAARPDFVDLWPVHRPPYSTRPTLSLMLCRHSLKILDKFWTVSPAFSFCTRPRKLCSWSCGLLLKYVHARAAPEQLIRIPAGGVQAPVLCKFSGGLLWEAILENGLYKTEVLNYGVYVYVVGKSKFTPGAFTNSQTYV